MREYYEHGTQTQVDHSNRAYDGAKLTWHRVKRPGDFEFGRWYIVKVQY